LIQIALIGAGVHARTHLEGYECLRRTGIAVRVHLVIDPDERRGRELAGRAGASWRARLDDRGIREIDAADICTPTNNHLESALICAGAGLPTLIDKPLAPTVHEAELIAAAFQHAGCPLTPGLSTRYLPGVRSLAAATRRGDLGETKLVHIQHLQGYPWRLGWRAWQHGAAASGGRLVHLGVHDVDLACWLIDTPPLSVRVFAQALAPGREQCWTRASVQIEFQAAVASITTCWDVMPQELWRKRCLIIGTEGAGDYDSLRDESVFSGCPTDPVGYSESIRLELGDWLHSIDTGSQTDSQVKQALTSLRVAVAASESAGLQGAPIRIGAAATP